MDAWQETTGQALANIESSRVGQGSSALPPKLSETDGDERLPRPIEAVVYEFAIRWPCPKDTLPSFYQSRLIMLGRDCAEMAPGLLRKAGDRIARTPGRINVLPSASELHQAANEIIAERAAKQEADKRQAAAEAGRPLPPVGDKAAAYARANLDAIRKGWRVMQTDDGSLFRLGDPGEMRCVRRDGSAIVPFHRKDGEVEGVPAGWYVRQEDVEVCAACYRHYGAGFGLQGARVVEVAQH